MELNGQNNFIEGRIQLDVGCISVAKCLNLFWGWWGCCGVPPQVNLRFILILTGGGKIAVGLAPAVGVEWWKGIYRR